MRDYVIVNMTDPSEEDDIEEMVDQFIKDIEDGTQALFYNARVNSGKAAFDRAIESMSDAPNE